MKPKNRNRPAKAGTPNPPMAEPIAITDIAALEKICAEPIVLELVVRGTPVRFTGRRLKPAEAHEVQLIIERALPPRKKEGDKEEVYDFSDPDYLRSKREQQSKGRAFAVWMAFPCFRERALQELTAPLPAHPGAPQPPVLQGKVPQNVDEIWKWVSARQLDDDILEALYGSLIRAEVGYLGFTSDNSSPKS